MSALTAEEKSQALEFFSNAQKTLAKKLEEIDGQEKFSFNSWDHKEGGGGKIGLMRGNVCLLYTSPSPRDGLLSRMPSSA